MIVFLIDQRLNKVGMARADITDYVREQRALLNTLAYTFEQLSIINLVTKEFTMYTRKSVLQNLSPYKCADFNRALHKLSLPYTKLAADETAAENFLCRSSSAGWQRNRRVTNLRCRILLMTAAKRTNRSTSFGATKVIIRFVLSDVMLLISSAPKKFQIRTAKCLGSGSGSQPRQNRFSLRYEPRHPHAHERDHRYDGSGPGRSG